MTKSFEELQAIYINGLDDMSAVDASLFLDMLLADENTPFREIRIPRLERHVASIKRSSDAEEAWKNTWIPLALEDKETKERWLAAGATWECVESVTKWFYDGTEFYRWYGGFNRPSVVVEILNVRKADERLSSMLKEKESNA